MLAVSAAIMYANFAGLHASPAEIVIGCAIETAWTIAGTVFVFRVTSDNR